mgnify:CR=1 FL=1
MRIERLLRVEAPSTARLCRWDGCALDVVPGFAYCGQHFLRDRAPRRPSYDPQHWMLRDQRGKVVSIYAIRCGAAVKIGISWNVAKRLATLQTSSPDPLELLGSADRVSPVLERLIHERLKAHLMMGELFRLAPEFSVHQTDFPGAHREYEVV